MWLVMRVWKGLSSVSHINGEVVQLLCCSTLDISCICIWMRHDRPVLVLDTGEEECASVAKQSVLQGQRQKKTNGESTGSRTAAEAEDKKKHGAHMEWFKRIVVVKK